MLTGNKAFSGKSPASLFGAILKEEPPPIATVQPLSSPTLDRVLRKCLAKAPDRRWQSAGDLHDELQWIAETVGSRRHRRPPSLDTTPNVWRGPLASLDCYSDCRRHRRVSTPSFRRSACVRHLDFAT